MDAPFPKLSLSHGQMLWALNLGRDPSGLMKDQVRYLRQLGIPSASAGGGQGSGNRLRYDTHDMIELGVALIGLKHRFRPRDIQEVLLKDRDELRANTILAWQGQPDDILEQGWVKNRNPPDMVIRPEVHLRLHDRRDTQVGRFEFLGSERAAPGDKIMVPVEVFEDGQIRLIIPVMLSCIPWIAWALEAPETRPGPQ